MSLTVLLGVQRPPTRWGEHLAASAVLLLVFAGICLLMWRGWQRRASRQADLPPPPPLPDRPADVPAGGHLEEPVLDGVYLGTTSAGDWLDRVVVHGLGERANARLELRPDGVAVRRAGREPFLVPFAALRDVRLDRALANTVIGDGAVVVLTWRHGGRLLDTGIRGASPEANARWVAALDELATGGRTP